MPTLPLRGFSVSFADIGTLHIIEEGELLLRIDGGPRVERLGRGDVILLPRGDPHQISDAGERAHATVGSETAAPNRRAGSAERSRSATRRRATCSRVSLP